MQRLTITIDDDLDAELDGYMRARGYDNRSEALRDLARAGLQQAALETGGEKPCVAALIYVYDHETRDLPKRLTHGFHARHDLAQATLHMHLDHDRCMEITVLKGKGADVQKFANHVIAERGVRHGHVVYLPNDAGHEHETDHGRMPRTIESASTHDDCRGSSCHLLIVGDRGTLYAHA